MLGDKHKSSYVSGMANVLDTSKRAQILPMLVEGMSMRSVSRITGVSINTVSKLLVDARAPKPVARGPYKKSRITNS